MGNGPVSRCTQGRTQPQLWEAAKKEAVERLGRHSARAMQLAARLYQNAGGGYCGRQTEAQRRMVKWTAEEWQTAPGALKKACQRLPGGQLRCDRYLPKAAWEALSEGQKRATRAKKRSSPSQYVPNTRKAAQAGRKARL